MMTPGVEIDILDDQRIEPFIKSTSMIIILRKEEQSTDKIQSRKKRFWLVFLKFKTIHKLHEVN